MQSKNTKSKRTVKRRTSPPGCSVILSAERWKVVCEIMEWSLLEWQKQANPKSAKLLVELMGLPLEIRRQVLEHRTPAVRLRRHERNPNHGNHAICRR
jgi:hypothetical protein